MSNSVMLWDKDIREPLFEFLYEIYGKNRITDPSAEATTASEQSFYSIANFEIFVLYLYTK